MAMASWCEHCGSVYLEGEPYVPNCAECTPQEDNLTGWPLVVAWLGVIGGSWALLGLVVYGLAWVLQ